MNHASVKEIYSGENYEMHLHSTQKLPTFSKKS